MARFISFDVGGFVFLIYFLLFLAGLNRFEIPPDLIGIVLDNFLGAIVSILVLAYTLSRVFGFILYNIYVRVWDPYRARKLNREAFWYLEELLNGTKLIEYLKSDNQKFLMFVQFCYHLGDEGISSGAEPIDEKIGREQYSANALQMMTEEAPVLSAILASIATIILHFATRYFEFALNWSILIPIGLALVSYVVFRGAVKQCRNNSFELTKFYLSQKEKFIEKAVDNIEKSIKEHPKVWGGSFRGE
jgi:hypothetical protein